MPLQQRDRRSGKITHFPHHVYYSFVMHVQKATLQANVVVQALGVGANMG